MIGKKQLLILMIFLFTGLTACKTVRNISSTYRDQPLVIDGKLDEWKQDATYDRSSKLHYAVTHDKDNIYVGLMVKDDIVQRKILMFGLTLWIDTTGGKKQMKGVRYPIPSKEREKDESRNLSDRDLPERTRQAMPDDNTGRIIKPALMDKMTLIGFDDFEKETVSVAEQTGINARIQRQELIGLTYELKIPIDMLYADETLHDKDLSLGIITGHLDSPDRGSDLRSPGGMNPGGGMSPGRGRGGQRDRREREPGNLEELQETTKLWLKGIEFEGEGQ
ncbi:MAG: hypothetical protein ACQER7_12690 [Bacteroidota bacterium]